VLLAAALLVFVFRDIDARGMVEALRTAHPLYLSGVIAATAAYYFTRAWRWGYLLAPLARVPLRRLFSVTVVGFMTGLIVPRAGEVVRPYLIGRRYRVSTSAAFASIILERLFDLITVAVLFGAYLYVLPAPAQQTSGPLIDVLKLGGAAAGGIALSITFLLAIFHTHSETAMRIAGRVLARLPKKIAHAIGGILSAFSEGLAVLKAPAVHLLAIAGQSLLTWLLIALAVHWNNQAFGLGLPFHSAFLIVGFLTVGVAVPTPGMVGGYHEAYKLALTEAFAVAPEPAVAAGIASHALNNLPVLLLGLYYLGREGLTFGKVAEMTEQAEAAKPEEDRA
jgi:uncharacterized protein (TIRG00374 family)